MSLTQRPSLFLQQHTGPTTRPLLIAATAVSAALLLPRTRRLLRKIPPMIYDAVILDMTAVWYRAVLSRIDDGIRILDVGIGTAGALIRSKDLVESKQLSITGVDYNPMYVDAANEALAACGLQSSVNVRCMSIYDKEDLENLIRAGQGSDGKEIVEKFDAAYFSGSLSLMPDPAAALVSVSSLVKSGGKIYVTQTFQRKAFPLLSKLKPAMKLVSTIDFGRLVMMNEIIQIYEQSGLKMLEHGILPGSVNNTWQAAYLSVLLVP